MRPDGRAETHIATHGASAPAPLAVPVRFQFDVIICLLRFPAVVPFASPAPGFGSRVRSPGRLLDNPSTKFKSVKIVLLPELTFRRRSSGFAHPSGSPGFRPAPPGFAPCSGQDRMAGFSTAVRRPGLPPGSGLLFRSFAVRFVHGLYLEFVLFVRSVHFRSFHSLHAACFRFVRFEFGYSLFACSHAFYYLFFISRVYYTREHINFKWIFYRKTCSFCH